MLVVAPNDLALLMGHRFVVLADRVRGFDTLDDAKQFALANVPAVICERVRTESGSTLVEIMRHELDQQQPDALRQRHAVLEREL